MEISVTADRSRLKLHFRMAVSVLAVFVISGCATQITFRRREALDNFVGLDRATVIDKLGAPTRVIAQNNIEFLAYDEHTERWIAGRPGTSSPDNRSYGPWVKDSNCSTVFRIAGGKIDAWSVDGNDCRDLSFPATGVDTAELLAKVKLVGVERIADYPHNPYTGRSPVNDGQFYSQ